MRAKEYIKAGLNKKDRENVYDLQFILLLHLEEGEKLPDWLEKKIKKCMERYDFKRRSEIIAQAITSSLAATVLAKKASRQTTGESLQIEYLREERGININKLPDNGQGSIRIMGGELIYDSKRSHSGATKTIDAICGTDLIALKYVDASGGAQDNQILDLKNFIKAAKEYLKLHNDFTFSVIIDGDYIESKIPELKALGGQDVRILTSSSYFAPNKVKFV